MGDRAQVKIQDTGVYLYTHWAGYNLPSVVQSALKREVRWDDPEYLARVVFEEMIKPSLGSEGGFGIDTQQHGDIYRLVIIDCADQTVVIKDFDKEVYRGSFQEFINNPVPVGEID
jgi:hypothetical protein